MIRERNTQNNESEKGVTNGREKVFEMVQQSRVWVRRPGGKLYLRTSDKFRYDLSDRHSRIECGNHRNIDHVLQICRRNHRRLLWKPDRQDKEQNGESAPVDLVAVFAIPSSLGKTAQYAYFFIAYTLLNAVFYTANNIAYASLTSLITKNGNERVQMGSIRFMFSLATNIIVQSITVGLVTNFGGGAKGWRTVAFIYAIIAFIVNAISVFSVKELPPEENETESGQGNEEKISFLESMKLLLSNKYFLMIAAFYILTYVQTGIAGIGIYYMTYVLGNPALLGTFSMAQMLPMVIGLAFTPALVKKFKGMYKVNLTGYCLAAVFRIGFIIGGYMGNIPLMLGSSVLAGFCTSPATGDINALISATSDYTVRTTGKHIEGAMFSCSSLGIKVGGGIGSAISGLLLSASGYVAGAAQQSASTINMLNFMYLWFPLISIVLIAVIMYFLKVEKANADWDAAHGVK